MKRATRQLDPRPDKGSRLGKLSAWIITLAIGSIWIQLVSTPQQDHPAVRAQAYPLLGAPPPFPEPPSLGLPLGSVSPALPGLELDQYFYLPFISNTSSTLAVDPSSRQASLDFYRTYYQVSSVSPGWTGNVGACISGTTTQAFRDSVALRINYFRAMAGVPATVTLLDAYNQKAQQAALMMSANGSLSHDPPPTWTCYSTGGDEAAGNSNLALGSYGTGALQLYMQDPGSGNSFVGHRRWILYPQTQNMGTGDIPGSSGYWGANDLWVFDSHMWEARPATREAFVAWPPPGYVPYPVVFPRWSFSYDEANFDSATVSMTQNGQAYPVTRYLPAYGYGENTLVWIPSSMNEYSAWPEPAADTTYVVSIQNVQIGGSPRNFQYPVIVFDPN